MLLLQRKNTKDRKKASNQDIFTMLQKACMRMEQSLMQLAEEKLSHKGLLEIDSYININRVSLILVLFFICQNQ